MTLYSRIVDDYTTTPNSFTFFVMFRNGRGCVETAHGFFYSVDERDDALVSALLAGEYRPPKWWQFWRDDKQPLPDNILAAVSRRDGGAG